MAKPVTIAGGGLAGLTLGIALRLRDVPVTVCEAGIYPRHRVCGEFISGRGQATLLRLGLQELCAEAGAVRAQTAAFFTTTQSTVPRPLPAPALCLSRYTLDAALADKFRTLGGDLQTGTRWPATGARMLPHPGCLKPELLSEGIIFATGRRAQPAGNGARWFGLKLHARAVTLIADLEMHISPGGYVGLCKINDGEVNVCGLFRQRAGELDGFKNGRDRLRGRPGSPLHQRLARAEFVDDSFCAVAGISLRPRPAATHDGICLGDAITMIPPLTGNGMSMAFESAEMAAAPLAGWSRGEISWTEARQKIVRDCDAAFARRLVWAKWLQRILLTPILQPPLAALATRSDWFWRMAFEHTR